MRTKLPSLLRGFRNLYEKDKQSNGKIRKRHEWTVQRKISTNSPII